MPMVDGDDLSVIALIGNGGFGETDSVELLIDRAASVCDHESSSHRSLLEICRMPLANRTVLSDRLPPPPGPWSSAIEVLPGARYLFTAGLVGGKADGSFDTEVADQARQLFANLDAVLEAGRMRREHLVRLVIYLTDLAALPAYGEVRKAYMGDLRPALTLIPVARLARPEIKLEIEAVAACHD